MVVEESVGMVSRQSLGEQFNTVVAKRIRQMRYDKTLAIMKGLCHDTLRAFNANKKFYSVTGNTITSFSVGVFYKGKLVYSAYNADDIDSPTRKTLKKGEVYNLPTYYEGGEASEHPYRGGEGGGGQWGPSLGRYRLQRLRSDVHDTWNIVAVCPVEYAVFNERIMKTLYETYEEFPDLFSANIIYARGQNIREI